MLTPLQKHRAGSSTSINSDPRPAGQKFKNNKMVCALGLSPKKDASRTTNSAQDNVLFVFTSKLPQSQLATCPSNDLTATCGNCMRAAALLTTPILQSAQAPHKIVPVPGGDGYRRPGGIQRGIGNRSVSAKNPRTRMKMQMQHQVRSKKQFD